MPLPEHGVHKLAQVCVGVVIAVQIHAARRFQDAPYLKQSPRHKRYVRRRAIAVRPPRGFYQPPYRRIGDATPPVFLKHALKLPHLAKQRRFARLIGVFYAQFVCACGVIYAPFVQQRAFSAPLAVRQGRLQSTAERLPLAKRRIDHDQVYAFGVQRLQKRQVIAYEHGAI